MTASRLSRRSFLEGLGASAALVPLLAPRQAGAQGVVYPRRFILVAQTNGVLAEHFYPTGAGNDLRTLTLPQITAPLDPYRADITIVGGLALKNFTDYPDHGAGHENFSCFFTGARGHEVQDGGPRFVGGSPTIDQYVANGIAKQQAMLPVRALSLGLNNPGENYWHQARCFYRGANDPVTPETSPAKAFDLVFAGRTPGNPELDRIRAERRSMLDFVGRDLTAYGRRLGTAGREKVDAHLQSIRELEQQIGGMTGGGGGCAPPAKPGLDGTFNRMYRERLSAFFDLAVAALKCDVTRVVTVQLGNGNGANMTFPWLGLEGPGQEFGVRDWHDVAHRPGAGGADKIKLDRWFMEQLAALIKRLKDVPEGSGSMLDSTVVLWANHMGNGGAHSSDNLPWILAGRGGGYLRTGEYVRANGAPTNGVLKAVCGAMGVPADGFGDPKYGGELAALRA